MSINKARAVLAAEERLRKSECVQQLMADAETHPLKDWMRVVREVVDPEVCSQFAITAFDKHRILSWFPELTNDIFYGKYNRARRGLLAEGDVFVDVPLCDLEGHRTTISIAASACQPPSLPATLSIPMAVAAARFPIVMCAGSIT